jgi:tRNA nucleotidyltransferase (CCA-adding enzyme)
MQTYIVGGAVRDELLGLAAGDRDWVVVGATPQEMIEQGYLPVGKDFPVFLHPETREEYALARTERKTAAGYHGFVFHADADVTLEEDLARRDLTINAMARNPDGSLVDPFHGLDDLRAGVLRHVTNAFREDPVRILRLARFAARFADFSVAPETLQLMREMTLAGEVDALVAERVWLEISRGLMEQQPTRMFEVLAQCGALERLLPELGKLDRVLDVCAALDAPLPVRFACLALRFGSSAEDASPRLRAVCERLRVPTECRELAEVVLREHEAVHQAAGFDAQGRVTLLERCDAFRKPQRFDSILLACECEARARGARAYEPRELLKLALEAAQAVSTQEIAAAAQAQGLMGPQVGAMIHRARVVAVGAIDRMSSPQPSPRGRGSKS